MPCGKPIDKGKAMKKIAKKMHKKMMKPASDGAMNKLSRGKY